MDITVEPVVIYVLIALLVLLSIYVLAIVIAKLFDPRKEVCRCTEKLDGKTVLVTGGNSGIGLETARDLARRGAKVIIASSNTEKSAKAVEDIKSTTGNNDVHYKHLNLASFDSVKTFCEDFNNTYDRLDILVNNAGTFDLKKTETSDGVEVLMAINYFGPFLLTNLLLPKLIASKPSRIVIVSSFIHHVTLNFGVNDIRGLSNGILNNNIRRYTHSKLCQVLWMKALAKRLPEGVSVFTVHPGAVKTDTIMRNVILRFIFPLFLVLVLRTPAEGAQTVIHVAVSKDLNNKTGEHYSRCTPARVAYSVKEDLIEKVWVESCNITDSYFSMEPSEIV